jgi:putative transposase
MPRRHRTTLGGYVYHVLNRAVGRRTIFRKEADYAAFEAILREAPGFQPMRLLGYCLMPNHWHLVLWPRADGDLSHYARWVTVTHTQRYHAHYHTAGTGPVYQGRFKAFPVQDDDHLWAVLRYVERNPLRAGLVATAEAWRWSSLWHRVDGSADWLAAWPGKQPAFGVWRQYVNRVETAAEAAALGRSVARGARSARTRGRWRRPGGWGWSRPCGRAGGRGRKGRRGMSRKRLPTPFPFRL